MNVVNCCATCKHAEGIDGVVWECWNTDKNEYGMRHWMYSFQVCDKFEEDTHKCTSCKKDVLYSEFAIVSDPDTDLRYICNECYHKMDIII